VGDVVTSGTFVKGKLGLAKLLRVYHFGGDTIRVSGQLHRRMYANDGYDGRVFVLSRREGA
jgi:hypothetical protein